jgi:RNA polymerase sigma-70 factor (ECF subfamily)
VNDDAPLIDRSLQGDTAAFGTLVQRYEHQLFRAVALVVSAREDAEDVVQETFVQAYLKLSTFQRQSAFFTWLYRIAFNFALTRRRRHKPQASLDAAREHAGIDVPDRAPAVDSQLLLSERATLLRAALDELGGEQRAILVLREMEGLEYDTIAQVLEIPGGTVRSRLHRARLQLRELLKAKLENNTVP